MKKSILVLLVLIRISVQAQDPNFSQFHASPLTLNPALTGKFDGVFRVAGNYRDQWPAISKAFVTSTASFDMGILPNRISETDKWGIGVMAMTDKTADGILNSNFLSFSTAYHKGLDEDGLNQIGVGFQGGYSSKRLDGTKLNLEDELDQQGTWTNTSSDITVNNRMISVNYFDFNAGVLFNGSSDGINNYYFGASVYHINRPKESFNGGFYTLSQRVTLHGGGAFPVAQNATVQLSGLHSRQAGATNTVIGGNIALNVNNNQDVPTNVYLGSWYRFGDALIPYIGLEFGEFLLGTTYDVNTSSLKTASQSRGGIEISLIYVKRPPDGSRRVPCPKF
ncbi:MAG: PorP/SprF family type IX secretion system membrane protein [Chitinophagaceae bacterium]|nr:PorP/SprF family type IX secretion system membrane protein [Chitinophagaceae bacterium]